MIGVCERPDPIFKVDPGTLFQSWMLTLSCPFCFVRVLAVVWWGNPNIQNPGNFEVGVQGAIPDLTNFDIGFDGPILIYSRFVFQGSLQP